MAGCRARAGIKASALSAGDDQSGSTAASGYSATFQVGIAL